MAQPLVRPLYLLAVAQLLVKNSVLVADPVSQGGNLQCCQGIEVAGGKPAETAVTEARVGLDRAELLERGVASLPWLLGTLTAALVAGVAYAGWCITSLNLRYALLLLARAARELQGRLDEAEATLRRALELKTQVLGADHPMTLESRRNLAMVHRQAGEYDFASFEAIILYVFRWEILYRWTTRDADSGLERFEKLVGSAMAEYENMF